MKAFKAFFCSNEKKYIGVKEQEQMEYIKSPHMMDFTWQMSFADGSFDVGGFLQSQEYLQLKKLSEEYGQYKLDPMNEAVLAHWVDIGLQKDYYPGNLEQTRNRREAKYYSVIRPANYEEGKSYPVIYFCHGGGQESFDAEAYGIAERIVEEPFLYVCPNVYGPEEFERIMNELKAAQYPVDESRVYVMGFSGGSGSALEIAAACPRMVAGVACFPGANAFNQVDVNGLGSSYAENPDLRMPLVCVGGTSDGGDRWPLADEIAADHLNYWLTHMAKIPGYEPTSYDDMNTSVGKDRVETFFGQRFTKTYVNKEGGHNGEPGRFVYTGDYMADDGCVMARFCSVWGLPHGIYPIFVSVALAYLKKFSRDPESGKLIYKLPPMDFRTHRPVAGQSN